MHLYLPYLHDSSKSDESPKNEYDIWNDHFHYALFESTTRGWTPVTHKTFFYQVNYLLVQKLKLWCWPRASLLSED